MVATETALPAAQTAHRANDKPLILGANMLSGLPNTVSSSGDAFVHLRHTTLDFTHSVSDESDASFPTRRAYGGYTLIQSKVDSGVLTWYFLVDMGTGVQGSADALVIAGTDFANTTTVQVRVSDTVAGSPLVLSGTIFTAQASTAVDADPKVFLWDNVYAARYWEVTFTAPGSGNWSVLKLIFSRQRQLGQDGNDPSDPDAVSSTQSTTESIAGQQQTVSYNKGRKNPVLAFELLDSTAQDAVDSLESDTDTFAKKVYYVANPNSAPSTVVYGKIQSSQLVKPSVEGSRERWEMNLLETLPRAEEQV